VWTHRQRQQKGAGAIILDTIRAALAKAEELQAAIENIPLDTVELDRAEEAAEGIRDTLRWTLEQREDYQLDKARAAA
jgi:hypothetical protein